jgi:hypothetical protein
MIRHVYFLSANINLCKIILWLKAFLFAVINIWLMANCFKEVLNRSSLHVLYQFRRHFLISVSKMITDMFRLS